MKRYFLIKEINEEDMTEKCLDYNEKPINLNYGGACSEYFQLSNGDYLFGLEDNNHSTIEIEIE